MRRLLAATLCGLTVAATVAFAQSADVQDPLLTYRSRPTLETIDENFPDGAFNDRLEGYAELCCLVRDNGTLACAVIGESPAGYGFGDAARRVANEIRLTVESTKAARERGQPLRVPVNFRQPRFQPAPKLETHARCGGAMLTPATPEPEPPRASPPPDPLVSAQQG